MGRSPWIIQDGDLETPEQKGKRMWALWVASFTLLIDSIVFSITLPSMALYMAHLEGWDVGSDGSTNSHLLYGLAVSSYSIGQMVGSPFAGWLCNKIGPKIPLVALLMLFAFTSLWYALAQAGWELIVARFLIGFADGNITICRTFVAQATTTEERSKYVSRLGGCQGVGFTMGFFIGGAIAPINLFPNSKRFNVNTYTGPGYLSFIIGIINVLFVVFLFRPFGESESDSAHWEKGSKKEKRGLLAGGEYGVNETTVEDPYEKKSGRGVYEEIEDGEGEEKKSGVSSLPFSTKLGIGLCIATWFILITSFSLFETIQTPYLNDNYGWDPFMIGLTGAFAGVLIIFEAIALPKLTSRWGEKAIMVAGFGGCSVSLFLLAYPWSPEVPSPIYFVAFLYIFFLGYGFAQLSELVLYSKLLGNLPQGVFMGYLTSSGSLARIVGPLWAVSLYNLNHNGTPMFLVVGAVMLLGTFLGMGIPQPQGR